MDERVRSIGGTLLKGKPKEWGRNPSQCHTAHHKSHMRWPGIEPGHQRWETDPRSTAKVIARLYDYWQLKPGSGDQPRSGFDLRTSHVEFMVDKLILGHVYLQLLQFFPVSVIPPLFHTHLLTPITDAACQQSTVLLCNVWKRLPAAAYNRSRTFGVGKVQRQQNCAWQLEDLGPVKVPKGGKATLHRSIQSRLEQRPELKQDSSWHTITNSPIIIHTIRYLRATT
jgi:hypothetical protein